MRFIQLQWRTLATLRSIASISSGRFLPLNARRYTSRSSLTMSSAPSATATDERDQLPTSRPPKPLPAPDPSTIPAFVLIAPPPRTHPRTKVTAPSLCAAWRDALAADDVPAEVAARFVVKEAKLDPAALAAEFGACACVVSPANAFGIMDGGCVSLASVSRICG